VEILKTFRKIGQSKIKQTRRDNVGYFRMVESKLTTDGILLLQSIHAILSLPASLTSYAFIVVMQVLRRFQPSSEC
jgi:hypothetical protein